MANTALENLLNSAFSPDQLKSLRDQGIGVPTGVAGSPGAAGAAGPVSPPEYGAEAPIDMATPPSGAGGFGRVSEPVLDREPIIEGPSTQLLMDLAQGLGGQQGRIMGGAEELAEELAPALSLIHI